jgi:DNA repair exonuclease SbcCD ATPase subunit
MSKQGKGRIRLTILNMYVHLMSVKSLLKENCVVLVAYVILPLQLLLQGEKEEEKEEVKTISGIINSARSLDDDDDDMLSEIESLLSGDIDIPIPSDRFEVNGRSRYNNAYMANEASEIEKLRSLVREMEEREAKLEGELLEYYGMKEMETDIAELQKQLKIKTAEINMLNDTINSLQAERKKLQDDVACGEVANKELEAARGKIKELQRQIQLEAGQTKGQLMLLKQQVIGLKAKEEEAGKKEAEVQRKLKKLKELEVEVLELRRKNKELLYEKRDLIVKLDAAEGKITEVS